MNNYGFNFHNSYSGLPDVFYQHQSALSVSGPQMVVLNETLTDALGLDFSSMNEKAQAELFSGNKLPDGVEPLAQAYAGHQFGHFTMLGDGRAVLWGEHVTPSGQKVDIQFKGSGRTPYSRGGDGRAVLGPMLREYLISEAMHALGIPTTRALAVTTTGEKVFRETAFPGAILTRVAASYIRVGTFEFAAMQQDKAALEALFNYALKRHAPELTEAENPSIALLDHVIAQQIHLVTHWMRVGFIHGVMNTDNMALSGETIDYGPCAFMDAYDPDTVFSSIDHAGRYAYANQPAIAQWNITRLAEALLPLIDENTDTAVALATDVLNTFPARYKNKWLAMMRSKLGLFGAHEDDERLIADLLICMRNHHMDYTNTFSDLGDKDKPSAKIYQTAEFSDWYTRWQARLTHNKKPLKSSFCLMRAMNPVIIPRNHRVEQALDAAHAGDLTPFDRLLTAVQTPYKERDEFTQYQSPPDSNERVYQTFCGT